MRFLIPSYSIKAVRAEGSGESEINDDEDYSNENYEDEEDNGNKKSQFLLFKKRFFVCHNVKYLMIIHVFI